MCYVLLDSSLRDGESGEGEVVKDGGWHNLAASPASGELTAFSCCYGYLQQVAEWGRFRHQQRIREAQFRQGLDGAESHSAAETDKGGDAEEGRWEPHSDANANNLFCGSFADKVSRVTNAGKSISQSLPRETLYQPLLSDAHRLPKCTATAVFFSTFRKVATQQ